MKTWFYTAALVAGTAGGMGCATTSLSGRPSALKAAGRLELIQLGTPCEEFAKCFLTPGTPYPVKYRIHAHLGVNPWGRDSGDFTIYRQWPSGLLLDVIESDVELELDVADRSDGKGGVFVYLNVLKEYKGYFAYSTARYSRDQPTRLHEEMSNYKQLGFEAEHVRARESMKLITAGAGARSRLPKLPLSQNKASSVP